MASDSVQEISHFCIFFFKAINSDTEPSFHYRKESPQTFCLKVCPGKLLEEVGAKRGT